MSEPLGVCLSVNYPDPKALKCVMWVAVGICDRSKEPHAEDVRCTGWKPLLQGAAHADEEDS